MTKTVLVPLAQGCEEIEAVTIIDVLVRANISVTTAALDNNKAITASRGVQLVAETTWQEVVNKSFDMIVLPGGLGGAKNLEQSSSLLAKLNDSYKKGCKVAAICAAPAVLVAAGLLDNKKATSYPGFINTKPATGMLYVNENVVRDGQITTSQGPATAMGFALDLVAQLQGDEVMQQVKKSLLL